ncbi:MAG: T9SS type A sorting domain-containing protein [Bacteroidia bacterium]
MFLTHTAHFGARLLFLFILVAFGKQTVKAQTADPGFGTGSSPLVVPANTTIYANEKRASCTAISWYGPSQSDRYYYENLETQHFDQGAWLLIIKTHHNPGKFKPQDNYFFMKASSVVQTSATTGYITYTTGFTRPFQHSSDAYIQIIQVDEYAGGGSIDGTLTVDDFDPLKGHGGILCVLIDGIQKFGINGRVDVSGAANFAGQGGIGGTAGVHSGAGAIAQTTMNSEGIDATPITETYTSSATFGIEYKNFDCLPTGGIETEDGGNGTGKFKGSKATDPTNFVKIKIDNYNDTCLTVGTSGKGGNGGLWGASAGGNGGSGATNWYSPHVATITTEDNSSVKNGKGGNGTNPTFLSGFTDANAGDGGNGGAGGGIIYMRAHNFDCHPGVIHFISNGENGEDGKPGRGQGGNGGHNGKGSDGFCDTDGKGVGNDDLVPPGGDGGIGRGGDGADGGSGGNGGEPGAIWLLYQSGNTPSFDQSNCLQQSGIGGTKGLGGPAGVNGAKYSSVENLTNCDCGSNATKTPKDENKTLTCRCHGNFKRLSEMEPQGYTPDGDPKWVKPGSNEYCYWDKSRNVLICYHEEETGRGTDKITSECGEFNCSWVNNLFHDIHSDDPDFTFGGGELTFSGTNYTDISFSFLTGKFKDDFFNQECEKTCNEDDASNEPGNYEPQPGEDGRDGKPGKGRTPVITSISGSIPASIDETENEMTNIYPNPVQDVLNIKGEIALGSKFEIINMNGQVVLRGDVNNGVIDVSELQKGAYFINLINGSKNNKIPFAKE